MVDLRKWFLDNDLPDTKFLSLQLQHVPRSEVRCDETMKLYQSGFKTKFMLTTPEGEPTRSLRLLCDLMQWNWQYGVGREKAQLCRYDQLPDQEREVFGTPGRWYIANITDRIKYGAGMMNQGQTMAWARQMLPGFKGDLMTYRDPDGKKRKRMYYLAECPPNWRISDGVYTGLWRWTYSNAYNYHDGYTILQKLTPGRNDTGIRARKWRM